jgi:preprotein translocase subunit SecE
VLVRGVLGCQGRLEVAAAALGAGLVAKTKNKENRIVKYFRETRAEIGKVSWPSRQEVTHLTLIVLGVTVSMSIALGLVDWLFTQFFGLIIG